jgi:hypothetical protein
MLRLNHIIHHSPLSPYFHNPFQGNKNKVCKEQVAVSGVDSCGMDECPFCMQINQAMSEVALRFRFSSFSDRVKKRSHQKSYQLTPQ